MRRTSWPLAWAFWAVASAATAGCFTPLQPPCAFSCAIDQLCPAGYQCGADGFCHRPDDHGACLLSIADASTDISVDLPADTSSDGQH